MVPALLLALLIAQAPAPARESAATSQYEQGVAAERANDLNAARDAYEAAFRLDPSMAAAYDRFGFVLGRLGRTQEALAAFERAVRLAPDFFDAFDHLGGAVEASTFSVGVGLTRLEANDTAGAIER